MATTRDMASYWLQALLVLSCLRLSDAYCRYGCFYGYWYFWFGLLWIGFFIVFGVAYCVRKAKARKNVVRGVQQQNVQMQVNTVSNSMPRPVAPPPYLAASHMPPAYPGPPQPGTGPAPYPGPPQPGTGPAPYPPAPSGHMGMPPANDPAYPPPPAAYSAGPAGSQPPANQYGMGPQTTNQYGMGHQTTNQYGMAPYPPTSGK